MTKEQLENYIKLYKDAESQTTAEQKLFCGTTSVIYEKYNYIIHKLLEYLLGYEAADYLEHYIWGQVNITFDELCEKLNIEDEINTK